MADEPGASDGRQVFAGRYRVDGLLGRGGMSEVFHGYDERLDRRVAIKVLRPPGAVPSGPDSPEAVGILDALERDRRRFLREIRTTARLEHPGIPAIYDTGEEKADAGWTRVWVVMQLLRGSTLEALLDQADFQAAPPPVSWAAAIAAQAAALLADVHQVDIVHRDIKPANVMIVDGGLVKVLDFGIAILRGAGALPRLTQIDRTVGTPAYMSPEQCLGKLVTAASDIYSLGCLLAELLSGDAPFQGVTDTLRAQHLQSPAPSVRSRRSDIPEAIDALVASMLAKDATARPSAAEAYQVLRPFAVASPDSGYGDRDPVRPFQWPLLAPVRPADRAAARGSLSAAEAALLQKNVESALAGDRPSEAIRLLESGIERASADPALRLSLRRRLGAALFYAGEYSRAASVFDATGREYARHLPSGDPVVLDCAYHAGHAYAQIGKPDQALPQLRFYVQNAMGTERAADEDEAAKIMESRFVIAQLLASSGYSDEALAEFQTVRPMLVQAFGGDSVHVRNLDKLIARMNEPDAAPGR